MPPRTGAYKRKHPGANNLSLCQIENNGDLIRCVPKRYYLGPKLEHARCSSSGLLLLIDSKTDAFIT